MTYDRLFSEGKIGNVKISNRIVMPAMHSGMANYDGTVSDTITSYYDERAKSGAGLIITEITSVNTKNGVSFATQLSMAHDRQIEPFKKLADRLHALDTKIFVQLHHPGAQGVGLMTLLAPVNESIGRIWKGYYRLLPHVMSLLLGMINKGIMTSEFLVNLKPLPAVVAPSDIVSELFNQKTRPLKIKEIKELEKQFIDAAKRAQKAGADGVELHGAHGYLINQFLSTYSNRRTDEYGGSLENRMRFLLNIIKGIRQECGLDFPVVARIDGDEFYRKIGKKGGIELDEAVEMAKRLDEAGVDAIDVSAGTYETINYSFEPMSFETGWRKNLAEAVKKAVSVPVIAVDVIRTPDQAEEMLASGVQDFVGLGRAQLADPEWVKKAKEGRENEITRCFSCVRCMESVLDKAFFGLPIDCSVNPRLGHEAETANLKKDGNGRVVAVIGAGPGGIKAAETCALRGFKTIVFEKTDSVGGQLKMAAVPPGKKKVNWCIEDLEANAKRAGAEIELNTEPTVEELKALNPHALIIATGAKPISLPIPGINVSNVCSAQDVLDGSVKLSGKTVAIVGSGMTGLETAEKLGADGNKMIMIEMLKNIGQNAYVGHVAEEMDALKDYDIRFMTSSKLVEIGNGEITIEQKKPGKTIKEKVDYVILAAGVCSNNELASKLKPHFNNMYTIGDANKTGKVYNAVEDGFFTALKL
ncbi:MAG: FAD-dependent oxidoreductase [Actinobacteria bacterium]|nr:FAD-dependent oxidoreductase [Actinomycetota bacterium]